MVTTIRYLSRQSLAFLGAVRDALRHFYRYCFPQIRNSPCVIRHFSNLSILSYCAYGEKFKSADMNRQIPMNLHFLVHWFIAALWKRSHEEKARSLIVQYNVAEQCVSTSTKQENWTVHYVDCSNKVACKRMIQDGTNKTSVSLRVPFFSHSLSVLP